MLGASNVFSSTTAVAHIAADRRRVRTPNQHDWMMQAQSWLNLNTYSRPTSSTGLRREYVLEPVAVGTPLNEAPLQMTELLNVGEVAVSYKVDSHGIKRANNAQGHGMPVRFFCDRWTVLYYVFSRQSTCTHSSLGVAWSTVCRNHYLAFWPLNAIHT